MVTNAGAHRPRLESTTFPPFARLALAYAIGVAGDVFVTVSLADTLFFSEQYVAAVKQYRWVRDHQELGTGHHDEAADSVEQLSAAAVELLAVGDKLCTKQGLPSGRPAPK